MWEVAPLVQAFVPEFLITTVAEKLCPTVTVFGLFILTQVELFTKDTGGRVVVVVVVGGKVVVVVVGGKIVVVVVEGRVVVVVGERVVVVVGGKVVVVVGGRVVVVVGGKVVVVVVVVVGGVFSKIIKPWLQVASNCQSSLIISVRYSPVVYSSERIGV